MGGLHRVEIILLFFDFTVANPKNNTWPFKCLESNIVQHSSGLLNIKKKMFKVVHRETTWVGTNFLPLEAATTTSSRLLYWDKEGKSKIQQKWEGWGCDSRVYRWLFPNSVNVYICFRRLLDYMCWDSATRFAPPVLFWWSTDHRNKVGLFSVALRKQQAVCDDVRELSVRSPICASSRLRTTKVSFNLHDNMNRFVSIDSPQSIYLNRFVPIDLSQLICLNWCAWIDCFWSVVFCDVSFLSCYVLIQT
jgi:hypothetical protein